MKLLRRVRWYWYGLAAAGSAIALLMTGCLERVVSLSSETITWSLPIKSLVASVLVDSVLYVLVAGALQSALLAVIVLVITPLVITRGRKGYIALVGRFLEFNVALLLFGSAGNVVWVAIARNKMYVAGDPFVEYFAFLPYSPRIYDYYWGSFRGHLVGSASDAQLGLLWASISLLVWTATVRCIRRGPRVPLSNSG